MHRELCQKCAHSAAWAGIWVNLLLVFLKITVGVTSGSKACIADGLHSASNIITAFAVLLSQRISKKPTDDRFHYGYGKVEFLVAGGISLLITMAALVLITVSVGNLISEPSAPPHFSALLMAVISVGVNEMLFRYMRCAGSQTKSQTLMASAWANRADSVSSLAVIFGVLGARMGFHHLDPIAALIVVIVIVKVSVQILMDSTKALMDGSMNDTYGDKIREIVENMENIRALSKVRTRHIGHLIWVELNILIDSKCTIKEGQAIADSVAAGLLEKITDLGRVLVHFQPMEQEG